MLKKVVNQLAARPGVFIWLRRILENNFKEQKKVIKNYLAGRKQNKVLDVGCGTGEFSIFFDPKNYAGIDIEPAYINYAKKNYQGEFLVADATKMPFASQSFDTAVILGVLHHLPDDFCLKIFNEVKRVLKNGGGLLIMEDVAENDDGKITRLLHQLDQGNFIRSAKEYRDLLKPHFKILKNFKIKSGLCPYQAFIMEKND